MTNFSKTSLPPKEDGPQYDIYNNTWTSNNNSSSDRSQLYFYAHQVIYIFMLCICIIGLEGNRTVISLLGFHIKRSFFTTYILNLAVADFGVLVFGTLYCIFGLAPQCFSDLFSIVNISATFFCVASQLLLTAISVDRCVCVLFPIWHRCHRPPHLSITVCALMWVLACFPSGSHVILYNLKHFRTGFDFLFYQFIVNAALCLPLITASSLILLFKVFGKSQQPQKGKILTIVLLAVLFFLIFVFPLDAIYTIHYFSNFKYFYLIQYGYLCAFLNSFVNPVIYYIVGRKKRGQRWESIKDTLKRAFKEEEGHEEELGTTAQM
ncbi:mas-related G-protein coupled receptor member H-like [Eublepharis macularius]|uniref:Mas-related G-protein coupled receptor member H-like n=1 Tax=Eublepharis macularius TaxID=481883 RepID=A0AA97JMV7_EUBMA|nr:mas-related G-protein coupled receptor member H-like [Eublepharis macularius]